MQTLRYVVCDVFTDEPLKGNQLAVFTNPGKSSSERMQALAKEMNFSESTFVFPAQDGGHAKVRIFTPATELPFAGHPILGTAFVVGATVQLDVLKLETQKGIIPVRLQREGARVTFGWMSQPIPALRPFEWTEELLAALGVARSEMPVLAYDNGARHVYVRLASRRAVEDVRPDLSRLSGFGGFGVYVFAGEGWDYKARMFHPGAGVNEDPATGSAAGPLAVHLASHGFVEYGQEIRIEQGAELGRTSLLFASVSGERDHIEKVEVGGSAVIVARGEFRLAW